MGESKSEFINHYYLISGNLASIEKITTDALRVVSEGRRAVLHNHLYQDEEGNTIECNEGCTMIEEKDP